MNKKLGLAVAALAVFAMSVNASIFKNVRHHGEIEFLGTWTKNVNDASSATPDDPRNTNTRITLGAAVDLLDDVTAHGTFIYGGNPGSINNGNNGYWGQGLGTLDGVTANTYVVEANIVMQDLFNLFTAKVGKQFYGEEGSHIVFYGKNHADNLNFTSADAIRLDYEGTLFGIDHVGHIVYAKISENGSGTAGVNPGSLTADSDGNFTGINNWMPFSDDLHVGAHVYNVRSGNPTVNGDGRNLWILGAKAKGNVSGFEYFGEVDFNLGKGAHSNYGGAPTNGVKRPTFAGMALIAKLAYMLESDFANFKPRGMFAWGSGDNKGQTLANSDKDKNFYGINPDFRPGEIFGNAGYLTANANNFLAGVPGTDPVANGLFNRGGLTNLTVCNLGVDVMFEALEKWAFMVDYFRFKLSSADHTGAYVTLPGAAGTQGNDNIGSELNIVGKYKLNANTLIKLVVAQFYPGSLIKEIYYSGPTTKVSPITKVAAYMSLKFGNK